MSNFDPFDLSNLDDVPEEIRKELKALSRDEFEKKILNLFARAKRELSIDEVTVAYYRIFHEAKDRKQVMNKLYNMSKAERPLIESVRGKKGIYAAINQDQLDEFGQDNA